MEHINAGSVVKKSPGAWNDLFVDKKIHYFHLRQTNFNSQD